MGEGNNLLKATILLRNHITLLNSDCTDSF